MTRPYNYHDKQEAQRKRHNPFAKKKKAEYRHYLNADLEWTIKLYTDYSYAVAMVYALLSYKAKCQDRATQGECCYVDCDVWKEFKVPRTKWYDALVKLRACGAIATLVQGQRMFVLVSRDPVKPVKDADILPELIQNFEQDHSTSEPM